MMIRKKDNVTYTSPAIAGFFIYVIFQFISLSKTYFCTVYQKIVYE